MPGIRSYGPEERAAVLERQRTLKMARSAHAYVRGNTLKFYEWLEGLRAAPCRRGRRSGSAAIATSAISDRWPTRTAGSTSRFAISTRR